jgi:hypothetical protein
VRHRFGQKYRASQRSYRRCRCANTKQHQSDPPPKGTTGPFKKKTHEINGLRPKLRLAAAGREESRRVAPRARGRIDGLTPALDVARQASSWPEPDSDSLAVPQHGVRTTSATVETRPVARRPGVGDHAPLVAVGLVEAVRGEDAAGFFERDVGGRGGGEVVLGRMCAVVAGVEGHAVLGGLVDVFDDVDFAVDGPVGALSPKSGPYRTLRLQPSQPVIFSPRKHKKGDASSSKGVGAMQWQ